MVYIGITATEAQIDQKTGANVSASYTDTMKSQAMFQAESVLNAATKFDYTVAFGTFEDNIKHIITNVTAAMTAIEAIKYDMSGYTSLAEAESMINILDRDILRGISILRQKEVTTFMGTVAESGGGGG